MKKVIGFSLIAMLITGCAKPNIELAKDERLQCLDGMYYVVTNQRVKLHKENGKIKECEREITY